MCRMQVRLARRLPFAARLMRTLRRLLQARAPAPPEQPYGPKELFAIESFFRDYQGPRSLEACAERTGHGLEACRAMKALLYENGLLGEGFLEKGMAAEEFMHQRIAERFPQIGCAAAILEIGGGARPIFAATGRPGYAAARLPARGWDELGEIEKQQPGSFDMVAANHSFQTCFDPIRALRQAARLLKPGGILTLFVPDGFSLDRPDRSSAEAFAAVPELLREFFETAGGYENIHIEPLLPNVDLFVSAQRAGGGAAAPEYA
jgi:hypothetical protein